MEEEKDKEESDDWKMFEVGNSKSPIEVEEPDIGNDLITTLRSDVAGLQYKRDKLISENSELKNMMLSRDQRILEQQVELERLREQAARQLAVAGSLRQQLAAAGEAQRALQAAAARQDLAVHTLERDNRYYEDKVKDLEKKLRSLELECGSEEQQKESARAQLHELLRRLSAALDADWADAAHAPETLVMKAAELVQETARLKGRCTQAAEGLAGAEQELRSCRDALERCGAERDVLQRQAAAQQLELARLRADRDTLAATARALERDLHAARDQLAVTAKNLTVVTDNVNQNDSIIMQLKEDLRHREDKYQRLQADFRNTLESVAILLSLPARFVEAHESSIKDRIREILSENKDKTVQIEALREKLSVEAQLHGEAAARARVLQDERALLEAKLCKLEAELAAAELARDGLRKDKANFVSFLERLGRTLGLEAAELPPRADAVLLRAEQLARLESDKIVDKLVYYGYYGTLPRLRRERSLHDLPCLKETAVVYQLQRRVRTLREQLQRRDLHLDLLRRKLSVQEESSRARAVLQAERDEAAARGKKLARQSDKLAAQLSDARAQIQDLHAQLADAAEYKITSLERARKIEELQKKLEELEMTRARYNRKVTVLRDQVRSTGETVEAERAASDHQAALLRDDLARAKQALADAQRREAQLCSFRNSIAKLLGIALPASVSDLEMVSRLQKLIDAHHDFTVVSRRYDDPALLRAASRSPPPSRSRTRTPDRSLRYDDSGYADPAFDLDDELYKARAGL
ncbi:coiled-coil domain-containing protein 170 [Plutella xylostella]|uniref:coiled-coil domain-containing protein 170 n=1 Tax=Plutella xylostella TaxID=51655 RepID=UPI002032DFF1|nr:coiled-coil domain-containing protein 170 [Plutella xylostella]